jgi:hypothetical protein
MPSARRDQQGASKRVRGRGRRAYTDCSGLTFACGFCVPTLSRDAKYAARDVPQGPSEHTRTAGTAARRRQRAHTARIRPQIGALARVQRVQREREERPDVPVQVRPRSARRIAVARVWRCKRVEGGRKAERVDREAAYAWLARSVSTILARKRDDAPQGGRAPRGRARSCPRRTRASCTLSARAAPRPQAPRRVCRAPSRVSPGAACGGRRDGRSAAILKSGSGARRRRGPRKKERWRRGQEANVKNNIAAEMAVRESAYTPSDERTST